MIDIRIDPARLPEGQADFVQALVESTYNRLHQLTHAERAIYAAIWPVLSRTAAPVVVRNMNLSYPPLTLQMILNRLIDYRLVWFDDDLQAVLQCAPFSALHTPHQTKAFGWDRAYACSVIDAPLTLLVYGPNTWLTVKTQCPRSGETLEFRIMATDDGGLKLDTRGPSQNWYVWIPQVDEADFAVGPKSVREQFRAFFTREDLETYLHYHNETLGEIYTLPQALYLAECLLRVYRLALDEPAPTHN